MGKRLDTAITVAKNLAGLPRYFLQRARGPMSTIELDDDQGNDLGIKIQCSKRKNRVYVWGLTLLPRRMSMQQAMEWSGEIMLRAAELRGYDGDEASPVDQHTHTIKVERRKLTVRNAIRLGFAVKQIICDGPTYFTQYHTGGWMDVIDMADYNCPDVRLPREDKQAA